jgi:PAS domain S-box-containing protein
MKIKYKLNIMIISLLVILTVCVVGSVNLMLGQTLKEETQNKELAITDNVASILVYSLLNNNTQRVQEIVNDFKRQNVEEVRYVYVVGFDGTVVVHTFENGFPFAIISTNPIPPGENSADQIISLNGESIHDVGVRMLEGMNAKVYIGFKRAHLIESIAETTNTIIGIAALILLFGIGCSLYLMWRITRPIEALVEGTKRVGDGDFDFRIDSMSHDEISMLTDSFNNMAAECKAAVAALIESEEKYRSLSESLPDLVFEMDSEGKITYANKLTLDTFGYSNNEILNDNIRLDDVVVKSELEASKKMFGQILEGKIYSEERTFVRKDGSRFIGEIHFSLIYEQEKVSRVRGVIRDITERKAVEEQIKASLKEKEVLLREIHHRVKNNLQVVSSMLNLHTQITKDKATVDVLSESRNRIEVMALIHSQLYESSNLSEINMKRFVDKLLRQLLQSYSVQDIAITPVVCVFDRPFPISIATPVGLIINELFSNVLKHAFDKRKKGKIEFILNESEKGKINLIVSDDGVGLPEGFDINATKTLGLRLVKILVENQLQGNLEIISNKGTTFNIEFDMEDEEDEKSKNFDC